MPEEKSKRIRELFQTNEKPTYQITVKHHVLFWLCYFMFNTLRWASYYNDLVFSLKGNFVEFPLHIVVCYFIIYYLIPKFIYTRKIFLFCFGVLIALLFVVVAKYYMTYFFVSHNVWPEGPGTTILTFNYAMTTMLGEVYVISFVTSIKITIDWLRERKRLTNLEQTQLETELRFLRTQISPHFFFNTLNNIYSLSIEKSDKAPQIILKLSELMRYMLYETKQPKQTLTNEIMALQNYLDLERIRYGDSLDINMNISGDIQDKEISPMLLLTFIENCFKHGANKNVGNVQINIDFNVVDDFLYFKVTNTLPKEPINTHIVKHKGGIGIRNVKKRLALGYEKQHYDLKIYKKNDLYVVELKIKVS
ncbi:Histidine kinase [Pustulibacterium marinum]|uniref:Histidine kinase n=1 Tax=Pustulibacterium marinum TaxID=1224947 RepID=A0A1I7G469_9FLAO|nr:sensor histidine kinase [Pustulibacterium marinum]SFU43228.1 Histidine kinase [Pustulibacterium marinum]